MTEISYRVFWKGENPKPKKTYHPGRFIKRQQARQFCRNRSWLPELFIEHPDGHAEAYVPKRYP